jgi:hypothetical protein
MNGVLHEMVQRERGEERKHCADQLWAELMGWCKQRRVHPSDYNDLFAIVKRIRSPSATDDEPHCRVEEIHLTDTQRKTLSVTREVSIPGTDPVEVRQCDHRYLTSYGKGWICANRDCGVGILSIAVPLPMPLVEEALKAIASSVEENKHG